MQRLTKTERTRVRRKPERANYAVANIHAVLDEMPFATISFSDGNTVHAVPTAIWREGEYLYIHGSHGSRLMQVLRNGAQACVSVTCIDGLVMARSALHHSMNYRSVCIYGVFEIVEETNKNAHLRYFLEHWMPGRWQYVRQPDQQELAGVLVLRMAIAEAVLKCRTGEPQDKASDMQQAVWAGVAPLQLQWQTPQQAAEQNNPNLPGLSMRGFVQAK